MPKILFIGDIVGRPGRDFVADNIKKIRENFELDLVIANAENSAGGNGITAEIANRLTNAGVDAITLGDHTWDQKVFVEEIDSVEKLCRPANFAISCPGKDHLIVKINQFRIGIFTVLGTVFMKKKVLCPFLTSDVLIKKLSKETDAIIVEIHAEATAEKIALGHYLDGRVSLVVGTHTHVATADECILPKGTAYLTDVGMTGPHDSIIGVDKEAVIAQCLDDIPRRFEVATKDIRLDGCILTLDESTLCPIHFKRVRITEENFATTK